MSRRGSRHPFGWRRLVALSVIAAVALGLGYLRLAPGPARPAVPPGARAGDLTLAPCTYPTEAGARAADCGTLVVPETRADPTSRLLALPVVRIRATAPAPAEPIFYLEGGPGLSNMAFPQASRYAADRDVVLVGYRGVDGSVRLDCPEVDAALRRATDFLGEPFFRAYGDAYRACADRLRGEGVDLAGYGLPQQVDDLETARVALGYERIDLLSQSAGTRTALIYAWRYPGSIHRSVMIGANPPGHFLLDAQTTDEQLDRYAALCAEDPGCRARTGDLAAALRRTAPMPDRWLVLPIDASNVRVFTIYGLMDTTEAAAPLAAPPTLAAWLAAAEGDASGFWLQSFAVDLIYRGRRPLVPLVWGQYAAAATGLDAGAARAYFAANRQGRAANAGYDGSAFAWGGGRLADAWPAAPDEGAYSQMRVSAVETLLIGGALDFATPPQVATRELLPYLPNGHQVVLPGLGHITSFFAEQPTAGTRLINTFLASGQVDASLYGPQRVEFAPPMTHTLLAKLLLGAMLTAAGLGLLSLVWMAVRLRRGAFGRFAGVALRSGWPVALGLGGWSVGALVTLVAWSAAPLEGVQLAIVAIGLPIGVGIALAWLDPADRRARRAAGASLAVGGALVGAWLGYQATDGPLAMLTTIAAAAAAANLALIGLDTAAARAVPGAHVAPSPPSPWQGGGTICSASPLPGGAPIAPPRDPAVPARHNPASRPPHHPPGPPHPHGAILSPALPPSAMRPGGTDTDP